MRRLTFGRGFLLSSVQKVRQRALRRKFGPPSRTGVQSAVSLDAQWGALCGVYLPTPALGVFPGLSSYLLVPLSPGQMPSASAVRPDLGPDTVCRSPLSPFDRSCPACRLIQNLGRRSEIARQPQRGVGGDGALAPLMIPVMRLAAARSASPLADGPSGLRNSSARILPGSLAAPPPAASHSITHRSLR